MSFTRNVPAFLISLTLHIAILIAMWMIKFNLESDRPDIVLETVFSEDRQQEEFDKELDESETVAETFNVIAGGVVTSVTGAATGPTVNQVKVDTSESLKEPDLRVNVGDVTIPGNDMLGADLGEGEVTGDVGRVVEGYGDALGQITQELIRMMRTSKVMVVWLFDESDSMKDDQEEIRKQFHKVYEELGIVSRKDDSLRLDKEVLLTSIMSFGAGLNEHTKKPTADLNEIRSAIDKIGIDESGKENMCQSISAAIDKYQKMSARGDRKLAVVVVSDESGNDGEFVEDTLSKAKRAKAPIYVLGRYSVFGYPYARIRWKDPKYGLNHWLRIDRGPETPMPECLQYDGLHERWDAYSSGFGPYEQVRLCRESGGIFFLLPSTETNLAGAGSTGNRKFEAYAMREYLPDLSARPVYAKDRDSSEFRKTIWDVIVRLNPYLDDKLRIREHHYPMEASEFLPEGKLNFDRGLYAMGLMNQASAMLEKIRPLRDKEASERWRAHYDLIVAQCHAYRVRQFQFLLVLDQHSKNMPKPSDPKHNQWWFYRVPKMHEPDEQQIKLTKVDMEELKRQEALAREEYKLVLERHPSTPWAERAAAELRSGFGMEIRSVFWDPRYAQIGKEIKLPNP